MAVHDVASGSSSLDSLSGKRSVEDASGDRPEPIKKKVRSWIKQWKLIKTVAGDMKVLTWTTEEPLQVGCKRSCPECQKKFDDPNSLKRHVRTHLGKSRNVCTICRKGFPDASKLKRHQISLKHIPPSPSSVSDGSPEPLTART